MELFWVEGRFGRSSQVDVGNRQRILQHRRRLDNPRREEIKVKGASTYVVGGIENVEKMEQDISSIMSSDSKFSVPIISHPHSYEIDGKAVWAYYIPVSDCWSVYINHNIIICPLLKIQLTNKKFFCLLFVGQCTLLRMTTTFRGGLHTNTTNKLTQFNKVKSFKNTK